MIDHKGQEYQEWLEALEGYSERVDALIKKTGKSQKQLAQEMGVTEQMLSVWKKSKKKEMTAFTVWRLAKHLNTSVDYLLFGRTAVSKRRPLPPVRQYQTLGGGKNAGDQRGTGSLPLG